MTLNFIFRMLACTRSSSGERFVIVCHCQGVNDRAVRRAVKDGARTRRAVARVCRAGNGCGGCARVVDEIIVSEERRDAPAFAPLSQVAATG